MNTQGDPMPITNPFASELVEFLLTMAAVIVMALYIAYLEDK